jgi:hypothetical protein
MSSEVVGQNSEALILARLIETRREDLSRDAADDSDLSRMNELSESARAGTLAAPEAAELDSYIHVSNLLAVMQSKARRSLQALEE